MDIFWYINKLKFWNKSDTNSKAKYMLQEELRLLQRFANDLTELNLMKDIETMRETINKIGKGQVVKKK